MTPPKVGEIRAVFGGYGLMQVLEYDPKLKAARMIGHGPPVSYAGHWFPADQLGKPVGPEVVRYEREEARVRNVSCNSPDCWCRQF
jgi:hypothetical protein